MADKIEKIENYVKGLELRQGGHNFSHTDRVRKWGLLIAGKEGYARDDLVETACLLHDTGLSRRGDRRNHGDAGAEIAKKFLVKNNLFATDEIAEICEAIRQHNRKEPRSGTLSAILMDADILDLLGPIGVIRCCTSRPDLPEYDPTNVKSLAWKASNDFYDERFAKSDQIHLNLTEHLNFQASCFENISLESSKKIAYPHAQYLYRFILDLEKQLKEIL